MNIPAYINLIKLLYHIILLIASDTQNIFAYLANILFNCSLIFLKSIFIFKSALINIILIFTLRTAKCRLRVTREKRFRAMPA